MIITDKALIDIALKESWVDFAGCEEYEATAREKLGEVEVIAEQICHPLGRKFEMMQKEEDAVSFSIDGFPFDLSWLVRKEPTGLKDQTVFRLYFYLSIWKSTPATRLEPEDWYDIPVAMSVNFYDVIRHAFVIVATEIVNNVFEGVMLWQDHREGQRGYEPM